MSDVLLRIKQYYAAGGLFNPEMMEHDKVRDLISDCEGELESLRTQLKEAKNTVRNLLAGMDESCCTCGADDWPNGQVDTCYYHESREFLAKYPEAKP